VEEDKELPKSKVMRRLVNFVDDQSYTIERKVKIILEHFINHTSKKLSGRGRGMVVVRSRLHCVRYKMEMDRQMEKLGLPYRCLVGFSGTVIDPETQKEYTEGSMNELPQSVSIPDGMKDPRYRILIVSNKFQTGYDEPLLHSMYVDKTLGGLQCVQTLSRLNRTTTGKVDTFVLDFVNKPEDIYESFQPYYQKTVLEGETDPNRLYSLETDIRKFNLFTDHEVKEFGLIFFDPKRPKEQFQPILNRVVDNWRRVEDLDQREEFRSLVQSFIRLYGYISQIISFEDVELEKLYVFLNNLNKKLPRREKDDMGDVTSLVDLDSFRIQETFRGSIRLQDTDGTFKPLDSGTGSTPKEEDLDTLSQIIDRINEVYGDQITEEDRIDLENLKKRVETDTGLQNVMEGDNSETNKRHKFDEVLDTIILSYVNKRLDFYNRMDDPNVKGFIGDLLYRELRKGTGLRG
jgi:type I restriction enzyme R subunit